MQGTNATTRATKHRGGLAHGAVRTVWCALSVGHVIPLGKVAGRIAEAPAAPDFASAAILVVAIAAMGYLGLGKPRTHRRVTRAERCGWALLVATLHHGAAPAALADVVLLAPPAAAVGAVAVTAADPAARKRARRAMRRIAAWIAHTPTERLCFAGFTDAACARAHVSRCNNAAAARGPPA